MTIQVGGLTLEKNIFLNMPERLKVKLKGKRNIGLLAVQYK